MCLDEPELFRTQLRALLRAGLHGDVRIMLPLIVSVAEVRQARALLNLAYDWPVQRIGPHYRPRRPQLTQLLVWRDATDSVQFMQLNPVTARLLALLAQRAQTGEQACRAIAAELRHPDPTQLLAHGAALLAQWRACGVVLGTRA